MASLNTLRTRGGVIVSIVIGIALLAFLLGDFVPTGCSETNVGVINGQKISYVEYSEEAERYNIISRALWGKDALSSEEQDASRNMAWESLVMKYAYQPGFEKLGLMPSDAEQMDMAGGTYLSPVLTSTFVNPQTGQYDPVLLNNFRMSVDYDPSGQAMVIWEYFKSQMQDQRAMMKYINLVAKGMFVNDLEIAAGITASNNLYDANIIKRDYSSIADSTITITNNDLKAYYNEHKNRFKQQDSREVEYVIFDLLPSEADYNEAQRYIDEIAAEFAEAENPMQYAMLNSQTSPDSRFLSESQVEGAIAAAVVGKPDAMYGPVRNGDIYTIAREGEVRMMPDSVGAKHILLASTQRTLADSLVGVLRRGGNFAALSQEYSIDQAANTQGGDLGIFSPEQMIPQFSDELLKHNRGDIFTVNTDFGIHVVQMTYKSPVVRKSQIATIKYTIQPSYNTQQAVYAEASNFHLQAAGSYDNFKKASNEAALSKRVARIRNSDRNVSGLEDSRELVRWAYTSRKGEISDIMEIGGDYVIAALTGVREEGIAPLEEVADAIRPQVYKDKKADILASELSGTSLNEIASRTGSEIQEVTDLSFGSFYVEGVGVEQQLIGAIAYTKQTGSVSKPVKGDTGVYVFHVTDIKTQDNTTAESEKVRQEAMSTSYLAERLSQALVEEGKIKDSRVRFF